MDLTTWPRDNTGAIELLETIDRIRSEVETIVRGEHQSDDLINAPTLDQISRIDPQLTITAIAAYRKFATFRRNNPQLLGRHSEMRKLKSEYQQAYRRAALAITK